MSELAPLDAAVLPPGLRSRFVDGVNGLRMHVLEAGEGEGRPLLLLLHGFPELAYSWRKVMRAAGRGGIPRRGARPAGLRPHHRLERGVRRRPRALPADQPGAGRAGAGAGARAPGSGGRGGARFRRDGRGLVRAAAAGRVPLRRADERALHGAAGGAARGGGRGAGRPGRTSTPPWRGSTRRASTTNGTTRRAGRTPRCAAGRAACMPSCAPTSTTRARTGRATSPSGSRAGRPDELAKMPTYYIMRLEQGMAETVAPHMPSDAAIAACRWLPERELAVYAAEYARTGFQGGLQWYRVRTTGRFDAEAQVFSGRRIEAPSVFIAGASDWGVLPGAGRGGADARERLRADDGRASRAGRRPLGAAGAAGGGDAAAAGFPARCGGRVTADRGWKLHRPCNPRRKEADRGAFVGVAVLA